MVLILTMILGTLAYLFYITKEEAVLVEDLNLKDSAEEDDLYKNLEDLFV